MVYALSPDNPLEDSLRKMIAIMPQNLQEEMLDTVLIYRGILMLHEFLKMYIHRCGLDQGPLLGLPYHPIVIHMNPNHYEKFPNEPYILMWYLVGIYTVGILPT